MSGKAKQDDEVALQVNQLTESLPPSPPDSQSSEEDASEQSSGGWGEDKTKKKKKTAQESGLSQRRASVSLQLQETDHGSQFILTAADAKLLQEILKETAFIETASSSPASPASSSSSTSGKDDHKPTRKHRFPFRDYQFIEQRSTFDRQNVSSASSPFHGFFTLFWLGVAMMVVKVAANNYRTFGTPFGRTEILEMMLSRDLLVLGITDFVMCWSTIFCWALQRMILPGWVQWSRGGWIVQHIWQTSYLAGFIWWTYHRDWPWTHTVFMVLHCLTMLMKQHSYASFNGYLSELYKKRHLLQGRLKRLEDIVQGEHSPSLPGESTTPSSKELVSRFTSMKPQDRPRKSADRKGIYATRAADHLLSLSATLEHQTTLSPEQLDTLQGLLTREIDILTEGLQGQYSPTSQYPQNLTAGNFCEFVVLPTLVYELEYPRTKSIDWGYLAEKVVATFATIMVMIVVSQYWIYPVVMRTVEMKEQGWTVQQRLHEFPWVLSDLMFPFLMEYLLAFFVIWECVLNTLAEITCFADRGFYADWWNSVSWDQFARDWNRPVHNFLLRHVYHSSISSFHLSRVSASLVTFFLSAYDAVAVGVVESNEVVAGETFGGQCVFLVGDLYGAKFVV
ncbi:hypothetical protein N7539_005327 [Penicillium diatomitis]|uniref:O-acyltransferase n=1 Tax=Penicillium diatomitis TaxID=2819901 RepID=A0A9X0BUM8_9EURO|nr:uncharacterized protein N7539_005327 [Penicillium diatomitis]KAJ5485339.1 hypothetical protein N7539_005327 [Penicillium diatomitis]